MSIIGELTIGDLDLTESEQHKTYIKDAIARLNTQEDLIELLNTIFSKKRSYKSVDENGKKRWEESYTSVDKNGKKQSFSEAQVKYFLSQLAAGVVDGARELEIDGERVIDLSNKPLYREFSIPKKSGKERKIHAPFGNLKLLLSCVDIMIQAVHTPHHRAYGFAEGKNVVDNAKLHVGKNYVYNIDLKDFFHSFDLRRVKWGFYNPPFNFKEEREPLAYMLACLCTVEINGKKVLPQGSPASPSLTNMLCWRLDHRLNGLAKRFGLEYSRYADDITFSSDHHVYKGKFLEELKRIIHLEGLAINPKKTRLQLKDNRQVVTGLTVNQRVNVSRAYIGQIRSHLYKCERFGVSKAEEQYALDCEKEANGKTPDLGKHLEGKLNFLAMVQGNDHPTYTKLQQRFYAQFPQFKNKVDKLLDIWEKKGINDAFVDAIVDRDASQEIIGIASDIDIVKRTAALMLLGQDADKIVDESRGTLEHRSKALFYELFRNGNISKSQLERMVSLHNKDRVDLNEATGERDTKSVQSGAATGKESSESVEKYEHDPEFIDKFLKLFSNNKYKLKYTVHPWSGKDLEYESFFEELNKEIKEKEMIKIKKHFGQDQLYYTLYNFLVAPESDPHHKNGWVKGKRNEKITIGWHDEGLRNWCGENPTENPFEYELPKDQLPTTKSESPMPIRIGEEYPKFFEDIRNRFLQEFRFQNLDNSSQFYEMVYDIFKKELDLDSNKSNTLFIDEGVKNIEVYTYTYHIQIAIDLVAKNFIKYKPENTNVKIFSRKMKNYVGNKTAVELRICNVGSFAEAVSLRKDALSLKNDMGQMIEIIKLVNSLCDFSIESKFSDYEDEQSYSSKGYEVIYLSMDPKCKDTLEEKPFILEPVEDPKGFTYIFRFLE